MKQITVVLLGLLLLGILNAGTAYAMALKAGSFNLNLDELQTGLFQDFKSGQSLYGVSLPAFSRSVQGVDLTLSLAGIKQPEVSGLSGLRLGGILAADGRGLAEKMGLEYRLPENVDIGLFYSRAHGVEAFGLYTTLKF